MDCFTLSLIYLAVVGVLLIFEGGYLYGLFITVVFLYWTTFKREAWDESIAPYISAIIYLIVAICNIFVSILCIQKWDTTGAAIGTALSLTVGNIIFMNIYYHKKVGINMFRYCRELFKGIAVAWLVSMFIGAILGGMVGTVASDEIYDMSKRIAKKGKKMMKKCNMM